jgi:RHS repeat-associated protein
VGHPVGTDAAGRTTEMTLPGGVPQKFTWDAAGRLAQVTSPGPDGYDQQTQYAYDYRNWRTSVFTSYVSPPPPPPPATPPAHTAPPPPSRTKRFVWGASDVQAETLSDTSTWANYASVNGLVMFAGPQRIAHDALGSAVGRTVSGVLQPSTLDAWGNYTSGAPQFGDVSLGYAGQHWDPDAGLSYAQQRWYLPQLGRFLSEDPIGAASSRLQSGRELDGFGYAAANPTRWVDPTGLVHVGRGGELAYDTDDTELQRLIGERNARVDLNAPIWIAWDAYQGAKRHGDMKGAQRAYTALLNQIDTEDIGNGVVLPVFETVAGAFSGVTEFKLLQYLAVTYGSFTGGFHVGEAIQGKTVDVSLQTGDVHVRELKGSDRAWHAARATGEIVASLGGAKLMTPEAPMPARSLPARSSADYAASVGDYDLPAVAVDEPAPPEVQGRPTWRQSEQDVGDMVRIRLRRPSLVPEWPARLFWYGGQHTTRSVQQSVQIVRRRQELQCPDRQRTEQLGKKRGGTGESQSSPSSCWDATRSDSRYSWPVGRADATQCRYTAYRIAIWWPD